MPDDSAVLDRARAIAEDVLLPTAADVDQGRRDLGPHLDLLAAEGFYGFGVRRELGGLGLDPADAATVVETLASGCLTTTFVWMQHHGVLGTVAAADEDSAPRRSLLGPLLRGERRGANALVGLWPGPRRLVATPDGDGWRLDGEAPWVTGWRHTDLLLAIARTTDDLLVWTLLDTADAPGLSPERLPVLAADAGDTVHLRFDRQPVPAERVLRTLPFADWSEPPGALRMIGSLAVGVAARCCALLPEGPVAATLGAELAGVRRDLAAADPADPADPAALPAARAAASAFALRAASTLVVAQGSRSVLADQHAQRLVREATFLLVFASRPPIRDALLARLAHPVVPEGPHP